VVVHTLKVKQMNVEVSVPQSVVEETIKLLQNCLVKGSPNLDGDRLQIMWQALLEADRITIMPDETYTQLRQVKGCSDAVIV
jgi:hypothetical protein